MKSNYKSTYSKKERLQNSTKLIEQNKGQIPFICEKDTKSEMKVLIKTKYLIKREITVDQFIGTIRKKLELEKNEALFLLANCKNEKFAIVGTTNFGEIYDKYKDDDGFLYLIYSNEKVWG